MQAQLLQNCTHNNYDNWVHVLPENESLAITDFGLVTSDPLEIAIYQAAIMKQPMFYCSAYFKMKRAECMYEWTDEQQRD